MSKRSWTPLIAVDFDGVLHDYDGYWRPSLITGKAIPGSMEFLYEVYCTSNYDLAVTSARSRFFFGRRAMKKWLFLNLYRVYGAVAYSILDWIQLPKHKPGAIVYIDDRAICFTGTFPEIKTIRAFRPWNKRMI